MRECGELLDPHTAIGVRAARECRRSLSHADGMCSVLRTRSSFPRRWRKPALVPPRRCRRILADLFERDERCTVLANDLKAVQSFVAQHGNRGKPL